MTWLLLAIAAAVILLGFTVLFGPPYLPTLRKNMDAALDLLDLQPGQTLLELGSGDGRVLVAAARRGLNVVGVELSPLLVLVSWLRTWRYRKQVRIIWGNYFSLHWPAADGIFTFMLQRQMGELDQAIRRWKPKDKTVRLASFVFTVPGKQATKRQNSVYLYTYH